MAVSIEYQNAFTEVCTILDYLDMEDYAKIPSKILTVFEKNMNPDYEYYYDEDLELENQKMLPETKAILFNLFRDYLSTPEQREKIIRMQKEDRRKLEEQKRKDYTPSFSFGEKIELDTTNEIEETKALIDVSKEDGFWAKIRNFFKKIFNKQ